MKVSTQRFKLKRLVLITGLVFGMAACGNDDLAPPPSPPAANNAPVITTTALTTADEGQAYTYTFTATDADADALTRAATTIPTWLTFDAATGVLSGTPADTDVGNHDVTLTVTDGEDTATQSFTIVVTAAPDQVAPVFTSTALVTGKVGTSYSYTATATDGNFDTLEFSAVTVPPWAAFDEASATLSGTPDVVGDYAVELMVSDGTDEATQAFTIAIVSPDVVTVELNVFENVALPEWAAWTDNGGPTEVVTDDLEHDQVTQFTLTKPSVAGFSGRPSETDTGAPFDASGLLSNGSIRFELKLITAPIAGTVPWFLKVEGAGASEVRLSTSVEGHASPILDTWQTYTFPLSTFVGAGNLDASSINLFMVFPSYNDANGAVYYLDNFQIISVEGGDNGGGDNTSTTIDDFESEIASYALNNFGGGESSVVANPDATGINTSAQVVQMKKFAGEVYGGSTLLNVTPFALPANSSFTLKVWSTRAVPVLFKLENGPVGERSVTHGGSGWEELTFDFTGVEGTGINGITFIFDLGTAGDAAGDPDNWTFYYDDIVLLEPSAPTPPTTPTTSTTIDDFESEIASYALDNFGGGESSVVANPDATGINTSAQVVQMKKFAGEVYGGSTLLNVTPFALPANSSFTLKVWSTRAVAVLFKLENGPVGERSVTHGGSGWEELTFDFTGVEGTGINGITFIFDLGTAGDAAGDPDNWTFYYDDIVLVASDGGVDTGPVAGIADIGNTGLVINGGFETTNLDNWLAEGANISVELDDLGTYLAKIVAPEAQSPFIKQSKIGEGVITAGQALTVSFAMKGIVKGDGGVVNALLFTEASSGVSKTDNLAPGLVPTAEWKTYTYSVTAGSDTEFGMALLLQPACGAVVGCEVTAYFDNVIITAQ